MDQKYLDMSMTEMFGLLDDDDEQGGRSIPEEKAPIEYHFEDISEASEDESEDDNEDIEPESR